MGEQVAACVGPAPGHASSVALYGAQVIGHGLDRGGELLAHASAEVTGVVDDDQAACRPCLVQLGVLTWRWSTAT